MVAEQRVAKLVAVARRGNRNAFGELYDLFLEEIYRFVFYRVGVREDAEDLTEQVFLKAWESIGKLQDDAAFQNWIYRIANNAVIDHYRTRKETETLSRAHELSGDYEDPEEVALFQETAGRLVGVLNQLSPPHQAVLILRFVNGLSVEQAAQILNRSAGAVRVLQHRALKEMRRYMAAEDDGNGWD